MTTWEEELALIEPEPGFWSRTGTGLLLLGVELACVSMAVAGCLALAFEAPRSRTYILSRYSGDDL
jgi:hypothetical protein